MAGSKKKKSPIGLDVQQSEKIAAKLNTLLANYQILYMNVRGYHWNISGAAFFELHAKFEEIYNELLLKIDELAERILALGGQPLHAYSDYLKVADIQEDVNATEGKKTLEGLLAGYAILLQQQRELLLLAAEASDEGTASLMTDYIKEQEKQIWMFNAYLK